DRCEVIGRVVAEWVEKRIYGEINSPSEQNRVAVRCRLCDGLRTNVPTGPASVLNHDLLSPHFGKPVCQRPGESVAASACCKRHYQAHISVRIGLRPRDVRDGPQRGSARGEMQKLSAGKFHDACVCS